MLDEMTPEWYAIDRKIAEYILQCKLERNIAQEDPVTLYNNFLSTMHVEIHDPDLIEWCITHIKDMRTDSVEILQETVRLEKQQCKYI